MSELNEPFLGYYPEAELVFALVCPLGTDHHVVSNSLQNYLQQFGYQANYIKLTDYFQDVLIQLGETWNPPNNPVKLAEYKIAAGNRIRERTEANDFLARLAASVIADKRINEAGEGASELKRPLDKTAHIIATLKRPEEVTTLRRIYGSGFFLISVANTREHREQYFKERNWGEAAVSLLETDAEEIQDGKVVEHGQRTRHTFQLADVFVSMADYSSQIGRFLDLIFGCPTHTPTAEEHAMFMAYASSLRSGDLSRQVGAAIVDPCGDLLSVGCNEAPKVGGGLYGPEAGSKRDIELEEDSNELEKLSMVGRILNVLERESLDIKEATKILKPTGLMDITEFGRAVHAEMEALLACARSGRSPRAAALYTTTFPCHNCCRHIVAAGIKKVVYIEPYAKSKAGTLHVHEISIDEEVEGRIPFVPFIGVGPRRYFDLFSLKLSTGAPVERKENGRLIAWSRASAPPRLQLQPSTYIQREILARESVKSIISKRSIL